MTPGEEALLFLLFRSSAVDEPGNANCHHVGENDYLALGEGAFVDQDVEGIAGELVEGDDVLVMREDDIMGVIEG